MGSRGRFLPILVLSAACTRESEPAPVKQPTPAPTAAHPAAPAASTPPVLDAGYSRTVVFTGTVTKVVPLIEFSGQAFPVDSNASFVFAVRVESIASGTPRWSPGEDPVFAIHSPSRTLPLPKPVGRRCVFRLTRDDTGFSLEVTPSTAEQQSDSAL